jgi:GNAT superfamily N-acetyltransferase
MTAIRDLRDDERAWANACYRAINFAESPATARAIVAERGGERVGLGRLVELEPGVFELGGIWTAEAARGHGVARAVVTELIERAGDARLWCIPFTHLVAFYASFGFDAAPSPWPASVAAKVTACVESALPEVAVLVRSPARLHASHSVP